MADGGDELADNYLLDFVDRNLKESLQKEAALHLLIHLIMKWE